MQLFLDLDSGNVGAGAGGLEDFSNSLASPLTAVGGQELPISLQLHRSGVLCGAPVGSSGWLLGLKPLKGTVGDFEAAAYLTSASSWSIPASGAGPLTATLPLLTDPIKTALGYTGAPTTDTMLDALNGVVAEIEYLQSGASQPTKSKRFTWTIQNWVNQGNEGFPATSDPPYATRLAALEARPILPALVYSVHDYAASGSATTTTGAITASTNSLVVANVSSFAIGHGVLIKGAGASGAHLVSTITAIVSTTITLADNAFTTVSAAVVQHDDTAAIQATINAVYAAGGGTVWLPNGRYRVARPWASAYVGGLLLMPVAGTNSGVVMLRLLGESCDDVWLGSGNLTRGAILDATDAPTAPTGGSSYQAVIGCGQHGDGSTYGNFNLLFPQFEQLAILLPSNPTFGGIGAPGVICMSARRVRIFPDIAISSDPAAANYTQPTHAGVYGILCPGNSNHVFIRLEDILVAGVYTGVSVGEHSVSSDVCIYRCIVGIELQNAGHRIHGQFSIEHCATFVSVASGATRCQVDLQLDLEAGATSNWYGYGAATQLVDAGDVLSGEIRFSLENQGTNPLTYSGCSALSLFDQDRRVPWKLAGDLVLQAGANAPTFSVYKSWSAAGANYERLIAGWSAYFSAYIIESDAGGSGTNHDLDFAAPRVKLRAGSMVLNPGLVPVSMVSGATDMALGFLNSGTLYITAGTVSQVPDGNGTAVVAIAGNAPANSLVLSSVRGSVAGAWRLGPTAAPGTPLEGDLYADSTDHKLYFYNGTSFVPVTRKWEIMTASFTAQVGHYYMIDSTGGVSILATLPNGMQVGDEIMFQNITDGTGANIHKASSGLGAKINNDPGNTGFALPANGKISVIGLSSSYGVLIR